MNTQSQNNWQRLLCWQALTLFSIVALLIVTAWPATATTQSNPAPDFAAIDAYVEAEMRGDRLPGVALAIVHNNEVVYLRGYGQDGNGNAVSGETGFILGSMSKSFTALAMMQLVEGGTIELDAPVQRYLPWFRVENPTAAATITVRQLLLHTSGIPTRAPQADGESATLQDQVRALASTALNHSPGTTHEYASPNYLALGAIIEQVSGQPYADYVQQHIFTPLDMRHSFTSQEVALQHGMARGHRYWFGFPIGATLPYEYDRMPTAAIISSAEDLGHYLLAQLNAGRYGGAAVLSPTGMAQLHTSGVQSDGFSYAFGWRVSAIGGVPAVHHGGIVPHFRGKMVMLPEQGWGVAVLTNASTSFPLPIAPTSHRMADAIAGYLIGEPLTTSSYNQSTIYLAITIGLVLVLFSQCMGLLKMNTWQAALATRSRVRTIVDVVSEFVWPLVAVFGLPRFIGVPWSELLRGTPDLAWWLIVSISLGLLTALIKAFIVWRSQRPNGLPAKVKA